MMKSLPLAIVLNMILDQGIIPSKYKNVFLFCKTSKDIVRLVTSQADILRGSSRVPTTAFTDKNIQKANAYVAPTFISWAKIFGHVSHFVSCLPSL